MKNKVAWSLLVPFLVELILSALEACPLDRLSDIPPQDISMEETIFKTNSFPRDKQTGGIDFRYMTSVGNGHLATVVYSDTVYVNGLYNGITGWSHRARIPSTQAMRVEAVGLQYCNLSRTYSLDVSKGVFEEVISTTGGRVIQRTFAHQRFTRLLVTEILLEKPTKKDEELTVTMKNSVDMESEDISWTETVLHNDVWPSYSWNGTTLEAELNSSYISESLGNTNVQSVYLFSTYVPNTLGLSSSESRGRWIFITSLDLDYLTAKRAFENGLELIQSDPAYLYDSHIAAWKSKWQQGNIKLLGNLKLQKIISGSFYYLLSSLPSLSPFMKANQFYGLSPGGLANGANWTDYQGHVFWDMETWMFPTMLMFHPELAKDMLSYRIHGMEFAYDRAESGGFRGLRYPWESARTGAEVTPDICVPCRENQQHITGDIALAARQYLTATKDVTWLNQGKGYQFIRDMAVFWASRPSYNPEKRKYEINGVMPPDEHAIYVNNSVYTNILAAKSIRFARYAACLSGRDYMTEINSTMIKVADNIFIPFNETSEFHPEFEGYEYYNNGSHMVKQADVILLGYPMMYEMSEVVRKNDLEHYANVTDEGGPAMTWGMFAIGWLELGNYEKAAELFEKSFSLYLREPFKVWTEARQGIGAVNFLTGMGGFLQTVFFGYGGVRLHTEKLSFDPKLPPNTEGMKFLDIDYQGSRFDVLIWPNRVQIKVHSAFIGKPLILVVTSSSSEFVLTQGVLIDLAREPFYIESSDISECILPEGSSCPVAIPRSIITNRVVDQTNRTLSPNTKDRLLVTQTSNSPCYTTDECVENARPYIDEYNYMIGENGAVYEGLGTGYFPPSSSTAFTVAFLGDFQCRSPNIQAISALRKLIKCLIESNELSARYTMGTSVSNTNGEGEGLYCAIKDWNNWEVLDDSQLVDCNDLCQEETDYTLQSNGFEDISSNHYIFETDRLPWVAGTNATDTSYMPSLGNGHIATVIYSPFIYMNGLYNGHMGATHRAKIPSIHNIQLSLQELDDVSRKRKYLLNTLKGVFEEKITTPNISVLIRTYAHQHYTQLMVTDIHVERRPGIRGNISLHLKYNRITDTEDILFDNKNSFLDGCYWSRGVTKQPETNTSHPQQVYVYWTGLPDVITLFDRTVKDSWTFLTAVDSDDAKTVSVFQSALQKIREGQEVLFNSHVEFWHKRWQNGHIEIEGNEKLSKLLYSSQYYLFSTLPAINPNKANGQFYGLADVDLAHGGNGHVTWLQESLHLPAVLLFHPQAAKDILSYRTHTMNTVSPGKEFQFPWHSAVSGVDVSPVDRRCITCPETAYHVTGDVAWAAHQYLSVSRDMDWLKRGGYSLIQNAAKFWRNKLIRSNISHVYEIQNVSSPDSSGEVVMNSAYTNYLAMVNILVSQYTACLLSSNYKEQVPDEWLDIARLIKIPFEDSRRVHLEFDGAQSRDQVHIPEAVMLNYPLMMPISEEILKNDLYSLLSRTDLNSSVFSWSLYTIGLLQLNNIDKAEETFAKTYKPYVRQPFKVWNDLRDEVGNSLDTMSAFLQAVIYGYGGLRIETEQLRFDPKLPRNTSVLRFKNLHYLGNFLNIEITQDMVKIVCAQASVNKLYIWRDIGEDLVMHAALEKGHEVTISRTAFIVSTSAVSECPSPKGGSCKPVVSRVEWKARRSQPLVSMSKPATRVVVIQTGGDNCSDWDRCSQAVRNLQRDHMGVRNLSDVAFNFIIGGDGRVYEGRGWESVAHFPSTFSVDSLAIGIVGDYTCKSPSDRTMASLQEHIKCGIESGFIRWNYTLLSGRQVETPNALQDQLLCRLQEFRHWKAFQYDGVYVNPDCSETCTRPFIPPTTAYQDTSNKPTVFATSRLPTLPGSDDIDFNYMASVGNGHLASVVYSPTIYINGLYNGPTGWSHRARIPSLNALRVNFTDISSERINRSFSLDVEKAVFEERIWSPKSSILQRTYAHQFYTRLLITEIHVEREPGVRGDVTISLVSNPGGPSTDITFGNIEHVTDDQVEKCNCYYQHGRTKVAETNTTSLSDIYLYWNNRPDTLTLTADKYTYSWIFLTSIDQSQTIARDSLRTALLRIKEGPLILFEKHTVAWRERWNKGRIEVDGDLYLLKRIYGSFYYLLSFLPAFDPYIKSNQFYGLSPGGLANGANWTDYQGHVFWDMETWMFPTMLMFHPELAKDMLSYRIHGMDYAAKRAESGSYSGLRFPWESAFTGAEQTPDICVPCRENQIHITGDIALAVKQYMAMTRDLHWLKQDKGFQLIRGMANFWRSRPTWNSTKQAYDINGVMPPDEHAQNINNSAYTNVGAKLSIHFARYAACLSGRNVTEEVPREWLEIADRLYLPFNTEKQYHPEFEGYEQWTDERGVKQADVILLGFPQMWPMTKEVRRNDLEKYEKVTNPLGPAMTWGMYAIGWLELGDEQRAMELFRRSYSLYVREPFKIWTEVKTGLGAVNFITGMGGFLQTIFFGYGGARIHVEQLSFDPRLPPGTTALRLLGIDYLGSSFDMEITEERVSIVPTQTNPVHPLILQMESTRAEYHLVKGKELLLTRGKMTIRSSTLTDCPLPEGSSCPQIRRDWELDPVTQTTVSRTKPASTVIIHHSRNQRCFNYVDCLKQIRLLKEYHVSSSPGGLDLEDVAYSFIVGEDGTVFMGRGWDERLPAFLGNFSHSIGIGILGDFLCDKPKEKALEKIHQLIKCGVERKKIEADYNLLTLDTVLLTATQAIGLTCALQSSSHWKSGEKLNADVCEAPCDPSAPRTLEGEVQDSSPQTTVFQANSLPKKPGSDEIDFRYMASVGNGHLATIVYSDTVYVNGLYNGPTGWTHRARIPSYVAIRNNIAHVPEHLQQRTFSMDIEKAVFEETVQSSDCTIVQRTYAHQFYNRLLITEIQVNRTRSALNQDIYINVTNNRGVDSADIQFQPSEIYNRPEICQDGCSVMNGKTLIAETSSTSLQWITVVYKHIPNQLKLLSNEINNRWIFAMAVDQNRVKAEQSIDDALRHWITNPNYLYEMHVNAWADKWNRGRIEVDGNLRLSKLISGSLYYLLSSLPSTKTFVPNNQFYGLSPGGLANGANWTDYQGHVFWDMETWMYPPILMFHPELAKEMLSYRIYSMEPSKERAEKGGYSGLRYPWEAAFSGGEVTPDICIPCRENQQHITGDIAFAARQYLSATKDIQWLKSENGYAFVKGMAEFWKTRPEMNPLTGFYDINGVMPPDEHQISINNSVYTNIGAKLSITFARYAACMNSLNATTEIPDTWLQLAEKIYLPFDAEKQYHPEFEGYSSVTGEKKIVKQADVILTGFPQMWPMSKLVRRNDLEFYEKVTHPLGPAMTWGMFAIGWLELGDKEKAREMFHRSYSLYTREPFKIWTEARSGIGAVNFITGMGGFLQAVLFGYGGIRLHVESLEFNPTLIPGTSAMRFMGLDYLGNTLDVIIKEEHVSVICRLESAENKLMLTSTNASLMYQLSKDREVFLPRTHFTIQPRMSAACPLPEGGSCPEIIENGSELRAILTGEQQELSTVMIHQTGGSRCYDYTVCLHRVQQTEDTPYHFLIGDDGRVYETKTLEKVSRDFTLKIGFIGDFTCEPPSELAMESANRLIKCQVERKNLLYNYKVLTKRQTEKPSCHTDACPADRLDCKIVTWKAWSPEQVGGDFQPPDCFGSCFIEHDDTLSDGAGHVDISDSPTRFQTNRLPRKKGTEEIDFSYMASVSNGHLATVVYSDTVYVNGLFNGEMGWSHRARVRSRNAIHISGIDGERSDRLSRLYTLDVEKAVFEETIDSPNVFVRERIFAHQVYTRVLITEITVSRKSAALRNFRFMLSSNHGNESVDLDILEETDFNNNGQDIMFEHGRTKTPEIINASTTEVFVLYSKSPEAIELKENENSKTVYIVMSVGLDKDKVSNDFEAVMTLVKSTPEAIFNLHAKAWARRWKSGRIEIEGNLKLSKLVYGSFYYLLSFLPAFQPNNPNLPFSGLSPGGLANGANWTDYQGHVFWDMETWMFPTMLMFHPELAKDMLSYRIRGMKHAYQRAENDGYEGLRFPWEAAQTGVEVTPDICVPCRENQLHITGDIAMAAKQYMSVTKDLHWLKSEKGYSLIRDIALFWKSRPSWNDTKQQYEIKGVMPPDEHVQNVSNSVYTNVQAQMSIFYARYMACINGLNSKSEVGDEWLQVAENLHIPFDKTRMYHSEYEGYKEGQDSRGVKQADAILLGFPLMYKMDPHIRRNDLVHYEKVTNAFGPAMTWGMFSIGWLELGNINKAAELFTKSYNQYTREPFKIWTEARSGIGAVNFITGMGGFLQAVLFGYGGARIYNEHLSFHPRLPPSSSGLRLVDMNYLGNSLDMMIKHNVVRVTVTNQSHTDHLFLKVISTQAVFDLDRDVEVTIKKEPFIIGSYRISDCPYPQDPVCPAIVGRQWSSTMKESGDQLLLPVPNVIVYQTGQNCFSELTCLHEVLKQQSEDGKVKYNFLVGEDGRIYEGKGWNLQADHADSFKTRSIAIGLLGDFTTSYPKERGLAAVKLLIKCGMETGKINETYVLLGEKQVKVSRCSKCPADKLLCSLMTSQRWIHYQADGVFQRPCCKATCQEPLVKTTSSKPTSTAQSLAVFKLFTLYIYTTMALFSLV